jgi:hypothetical protein
MRRWLDEELIRVTPAPILTRLEALDYRMSRRVVVLGGVFVRRVVAAADVSAR